MTKEYKKVYTGWWKNDKKCVSVKHAKKNQLKILIFQIVPVP